MLCSWLGRAAPETKSRADPALFLSNSTWLARKNQNNQDKNAGRNVQRGLAGAALVLVGSLRSRNQNQSNPSPFPRRLFVFRDPKLALVVMELETLPGQSLATPPFRGSASFVGYRPHPPRLGGNSQEKLRRAGGLPSPPFARAAQVAHPPACAVARSPLLVSVATRLHGATRCYACSAPSPARWLALLPCRPHRAGKPSGR